MSPEFLGKLFANWKHEMNTNGPPKANNVYPQRYPSIKEIDLANSNVVAPKKMIKEPMIPETFGPYSSSNEPTGRAEMLVTMHATVKRKFKDKSWATQDTGCPEEFTLISHFSL